MKYQFQRRDCSIWILFVWGPHVFWKGERCNKPCIPTRNSKWFHGFSRLPLTKLSICNVLKLAQRNECEYGFHFSFLVTHFFTQTWSCWSVHPFKMLRFFFCLEWATKGFFLPSSWRFTTTNEANERRIKISSFRSCWYFYNLLLSLLQFY